MSCGKLFFNHFKIFFFFKFGQSVSKKREEIFLIDHSTGTKDFYIIELNRKRKRSYGKNRRCVGQQCTQCERLR